MDEGLSFCCPKWQNGCKKNHIYDFLQTDIRFQIELYLLSGLVSLL